ncbi:MAG: hypothetical protein HQ522_20790 [Bacteroidetes bacterium]|nr:hypothetical protein [Bacteroidota bacterium]
MKKKLSLAFLFVLTVSIGFAQTDKKNIIKVFPTSFVFGKGTLGYERVINENGSITFNLGLPTGMDPLKYIPEEDDINYLDGKLDGLLLMPGYRFNFSKKNAPIGFFIEPYLKYESFGANITGEFIDDDNERYLADLDGKFSGIGGGFQLGFQFLIGDVVSIEWSLIGFEVKSANAEFTYTDLDGNVNMDDAYDFVVDIIPPDTPLIGDNMTYEKGSDYVKAKASNVIIPGLRSAFSIGVAF